MADQQNQTHGWPAINAFVDEYIDGYEFRGDPGDHTPTEFEKLLITDAIGGLLSEPEFLNLLADTATAAAQPVSGADGSPIELRGVSETAAEGDGFWRSCSGCHELNEGHDTGPRSAVFGCALGVGCSECGGIGAVWDTTDYAAMGDAMAASMAQPQPSGNAGELPGPSMSADRAAFFLRRFRHDEKMLGPNEQAAIDFALSAIAAQAQPPVSPPNPATPLDKVLSAEEIMVLAGVGSHSHLLLRIARSVERAVLDKVAAMQQASGQEEQPSITNPLTPYGLLVRALRLVADTTLMEMSEDTGYSPAFLSSVEFGREVASEVLLKNTRDFFAAKGIQLPAGLLERAAAKEQ